MCGSRGYPLGRYERRWARVHRWKTGLCQESGQHFHGKEGRLQVWPRDLVRKLWRWMLAEVFFCMLVFLVLICWGVWPSSWEWEGDGEKVLEVWRKRVRKVKGWLREGNTVCLLNGWKAAFEAGCHELKVSLVHMEVVFLQPRLHTRKQLCDSLEGGGCLEGGQEGGNMCLLTADSHCTAQTNTLWSSCPPVKNKLKRKKCSY